MYYGACSRRYVTKLIGSMLDGICDKSETYSVFNDLDVVKKIVGELKTKT